MTPRPFRLTSTVVVAGIAALLAGCASPSPELTDAAAARLQAQVQVVSESSAAGDLPSARAALDALTSTIDTAAEDGELSAERRKLIEASVVLVSADLSTLEAQAALASRVAAEAAAAQAAAAEAAAAEAAAERETAKDNPGKAGKAKKQDDDD